MTRLRASGGRARARRGRVAALLAGALGLVLLGTTAAGAMVLERLLLLGGHALVAPPDAATQAIVVLGGRTDRIRTGAVLHSRTGLPLLLTGKGTGDSGYAAESEKMAEILGREFRIQARWVETASLDTEGNARHTWCMLGPQGVRRIAMVTDARHMMRATLEFAAVGFEVRPVVAAPPRHPRAGGDPGDARGASFSMPWIPAFAGMTGGGGVDGAVALKAGDLVPGREGLRAARSALKEWAALVPAASRWLAGGPPACDSAPGAPELGASAS